MKKSVKVGTEEYEQMLLHAAKYTGNQEKEKKIFSASMLGNDPLQNFLKFKHGGRDSIQFEANTFGSIYQLGVDSAAEMWNNFKNETQYENAKRIKVEIENGWIVSGEIDQLDHKNKIIFDNKVTTATTIAKIKKEGPSHQYALQLGVYKYLLEKEAEKTGSEKIEYSTVLPVVDKGFSYFKQNKNSQLTFVEVSTYSTDEIEKMILEKTNELDMYIDLGTEPGRCTNLFPYKGKPMRCIHYCDFAKHCKHFSHTSPAAIKEMMGL